MKSLNKNQIIEVVNNNKLTVGNMIIIVPENQPIEDLVVGISYLNYLLKWKKKNEITR